MNGKNNKSMKWGKIFRRGLLLLVASVAAGCQRADETALKNGRMAEAGGDFETAKRQYAEAIAFGNGEGFRRTAELLLKSEAKELFEKDESQRDAQWIAAAANVSGQIRRFAQEAAARGYPMGEIRETLDGQATAIQSALETLRQTKEEKWQTEKERRENTQRETALREANEQKERLETELVRLRQEAQDLKQQLAESERELTEEQQRASKARSDLKEVKDLIKRGQEGDIAVMLAVSLMGNDQEKFQKGAVIWIADWYENTVAPENEKALRTRPTRLKARWESRNLEIESWTRLLSTCETTIRKQTPIPVKIGQAREAAKRKEWETVLTLSEDVLEREPEHALAKRMKEVAQRHFRIFRLPNGETMGMVWCPPGTFTMGSPVTERGRDNDEVQHLVTLSRGFWMAQYPVTQKQWKSVMGGNPSHFKGENLPVEGVNWDDCRVFCKKTGLQLPTEAQWEYACRAGTTGPYAGTGNLDGMGWHDDNSGEETHPVGMKQPNAWGLYDMHGNVLEWCADWYGDYPTHAVTDPTGMASGEYRVLRGGSWFNYAQNCRSAYRSRYLPDNRYWTHGFRPVAVCPSADAIPGAENTMYDLNLAKPEMKTVTLPGGVTMEMIWCPPGTFTMGSLVIEEGWDNDEVQHLVTLTKGFWMAETEVTQGQWKSLMGTTVADLARRALQNDTGDDFGDGKGAITMRERWGLKGDDDPIKRCGDLEDDMPMYNVAWNEARAFCTRLTERGHNQGWLPKDYRFRLPTEAEWEYACRAGTTTELPNGKDIRILGENNAPALDDIAWYGGNSSVGFSGEMGRDTTEWPEKQYPGGRAWARNVKEKASNAWGLYDMIGNVWEWCEDEYAPYPSGTVTNYLKRNDSTGPTVRRVNRGGGWLSLARRCRPASRDCNPAAARGFDLGFRPVCSAGPIQ